MPLKYMSYFYSQSFSYHKYLTKHFTVLFADDSNMYITGNILVELAKFINVSVVKGKLQYIIHDVAEWHDPLRR